MEVCTNCDSCGEVHLTTMLKEKCVKKKKKGCIRVIRKAEQMTVCKGQHLTDLYQCSETVQTFDVPLRLMTPSLSITGTHHAE